MSIMIEILNNNNFYLRIYHNDKEIIYTSEDNYLNKELSYLLHMYFSYVYSKELFLEQNNEKDIKFKNLNEGFNFRKDKKAMKQIYKHSIEDIYNKIIELTEKKIL